MATKKTTKSKKVEKATNGSSRDVRDARGAKAPDSVNGRTKKKPEAAIPAKSARPVSKGKTLSSTIERVQREVTKNGALTADSHPDSSQGTALDHSQIAARAWQIWQREGCPAGRELDHWLLAEKELLSAE